MTQLLDLSEEMLRAAKFDCWRTSIGEMAVLGFEDASLLGFVFEFETVDAIFERWETVEMEMINRFAPEFRAAGDKAWNIYSVFLTGERPKAEQLRRLRRIEEGLEYTRKLTGAGVADESEMRQALLPLLPLKTKPKLNEVDAKKRLTLRLNNLSPNIGELMLNENVDPAQVLEVLGQRT